MSYQSFADYKILAIYTLTEAKYINGICAFCGRRVYPANMQNKEHGYVALYQGRYIVMHGGC